MFNIHVTPELLVAIFAALIAIAFDWFPGLANWYNPLSELKKKQIMAGVLIVVVVFIYAGTCWGIFSTGLSCTQTDLVALLNMVWVAVVVNQSFHALLKPPKKPA